MNTFLQKPEELILAKLRMIKATVPRNRAIKDVEDIKGILKFTEVDLNEVKAEAKKDKTKVLEEILAGRWEWKTSVIEEIRNLSANDT